MDFDDHDDGDEENIGLRSRFDPALGNSGRPKPVAGIDLTIVNCNRNPTTGGGRYRECLKNHAVGIGGHAVDGCGEFMAAGEDGTLDALRCAACSCHRNFHRKEFENRGVDSSPPAPAVLGYHPPYSPHFRTPAGYLQYHQHNQAPQRPVPALAFTSTSSGREELEDFGGGGGVGPSSSSGKKRFRTKFTAEQKGKMLAFAERVGWRIQKHDELELQQFCEEASVKRHVFKVWMHNNKHGIGKQSGATTQPPSPPSPLSH
ncbi:ZF-HD homeobox protein [Platanthera zijinensis]|uniref:ZF-HD homeobox protein n=1 Tax=Platanthera zijinensis TaxID=2320716 RepID=A0AAP0FXM8_9ASPA